MGPMARPNRTPGPNGANSALPATSSGLKDLVVTLLGPQTFGIGVTVGVAANVARAIVDVASLARTFLLADLYDRAHGSVPLAAGGPLGALHSGIAQLASWQFDKELEQARADRDALVAEVVYAITNPGEVFDNVKADYVDKWRRFEAHMASRTLSGNFEAGRIFGDVLVDVVSVLGTGAAAAKAAARVPRLAALARRSRGLARGSEAAGSPGAAAVTPSQLTGRQPAGIIAAERPSAPVPEGTLRGRGVRLEGMRVREIAYSKRSDAARAALRREFDGGVRKNFLRSLVAEPDKANALRRAGMTDQDLARIAAGQVPPGYQVHHKLPLDDGGTNAFDNLVLMKDDPYHKALTNLQRELVSSLRPGDTATVSWPVPDGFVYPPTN